MPFCIFIEKYDFFVGLLYFNMLIWCDLNNLLKFLAFTMPSKNT